MYNFTEWHNARSLGLASHTLKSSRALRYVYSAFTKPIANIYSLFTCLFCFTIGTELLHGDDHGQAWLITLVNRQHLNFTQMFIVQKANEAEHDYREVFYIFLCSLARCIFTVKYSSTICNVWYFLSTKNQRLHVCDQVVAKKFCLILSSIATLLHIKSHL